jgi:hypothetical protein
LVVIYDTFLKHDGTYFLQVVKMDEPRILNETTPRSVLCVKMDETRILNETSPRSVLCVKIHPNFSPQIVA